MVAKDISWCAGWSRSTGVGFKILEGFFLGPFQFWINYYSKASLDSILNLFEIKQGTLIRECTSDTLVIFLCWLATTIPMSVQLVTEPFGMAWSG